jgi:hypothetical protein
MTVQNSTGYMLACPNCKEHTIPCSHTDGLLSDWCDTCNMSIFDVPKPTAADCWDGDDSHSE